MIGDYSDHFFVHFYHVFEQIVKTRVNYSWLFIF